MSEQSDYRCVTCGAEIGDCDGTQCGPCLRAEQCSGVQRRPDPRDGKSYVVYYCPECGEQETHYGNDENRPTTYCLNHEDEPGRENRPEHEPMVFLRERRGLMAGKFNGHTEE